MGSLTTGIFAAMLLASALAIPSKRIRREAEIDTQSFVGEGTNELATAILQGFVDTDENLAFSPLGHSVLLAILAEGANGETREQLIKAIHLPDNVVLRRSAYKNVLQRLTERYSTNKPQFKNWFYIYKNFSVDQEYKENLEQNYLTEVRDVDRLDSETSSGEETTESNEEKKEESIMPDKIEDSSMPEKLEETNLPEKMEDTMMPDNLETLKNPETVEDSMIPEKMEDSKTPEKMEDTMPEKTEDLKVPEDMGDSIIPENIEELVKPENADSDNPEKTDDSKMDEEIKPEKLDETMVSEKLEDKLPEKTETSDEEAETMQLSDVEAPSIDKEIPESRQFSSSFDYPIPSMIRKLQEEKKYKPYQGAITMQQEILGDKKRDNEEIKDDKKEIVVEEIKDKNKEKIKEDKVESEKKSDLIDKIKEEFAESIRDLIKDDKKESENEEMTSDKMSEMKYEIKEDVEMNKNEENTKPVEDEMKENDGKEVMLVEDEITERNGEKDDVMPEVVPQKVLNVKPTPEEGLIQEEMKEMGPKERNMRSLDHPKARFGIYLAKNDVSSSLSGNNIVVKSAKNKKISQILVFNAMYFKGNWEVPFTRHKIDSFYKSDTEKSTVTMMGTQGTFRVGNIPDLDSKAIELPYQGDRYSLLILMPNSRTGLRQLISDLTGYPLRNIQKYLTPEEVEVCLPSFEIQTTTNPVEALSKFGVTDVFNQEKADLSGISEASGLFVEELVQYVTVNVDEGSSSYNYMSGSNPSTRTTVAKYSADSPFLYFVRDKKENIIIVAGKVVDPSIIPKHP